MIYLVSLLLRALQDAHELVLGHCCARGGDDILLGRLLARLSVLRGDYTRAGDLLGRGLILAFVSAISAIPLAI